MVDVRAMGFPENWETETIWNWQKIMDDEKWFNRILKSLGIRMFPFLKKALKKLS